MRVATFGPTTKWVGKSITFDNDQFYLEGHGPIRASDVLKYDREGHLLWAYDGLREWVQKFSTYEAKSLPHPKPPKSAAASKQPLGSTRKQSGSWWKRRSGKQKIGLILGAILVLLILVAAIGGAVDSSQNQNTSVATAPLSSAATDTSVQGDTTPPVTYADYPEGWTEGPVTVEFSVEDDSSSPEQCKIYYSTNGGKSWKAGDSVRVKRQGKQRVLVYAKDASGNKEDLGYCQLKIDNGGPATQALNSPSVQKGKSVTLKYRINDKTPRATAYLRLTGPRNKTINLGSEPTGKQRSVTFKANLPAGTYAWVVYAKDQAGNKATSRASGQLVIEPKPAPAPEPSSSQSAYLVGITETGECYHTLSCYHWTKDPDGNSKCTVAEAQAMGFRPCSICNP